MPLLSSLLCLARAGWIAKVVQRLELYVGWRQAEYGAAEHGGHAVRTIAGTRADGVNVVPGTLDNAIARRHFDRLLISSRAR